MKKSTSIAKAVSALKKPLLIMKLTILLVAFCTFHASAGLHAQKISLKVSNLEIAQVLNAIQKQGDFRFLFNSSLKDLKQKVSVSFENVELKDVMAQLFEGTSLTYLELDNNLVAIRSTNPEEKDIRVTGKVTSETGEAVSSASVVVKGTSNGTVTNGEGNFAITVPENAVLVISAIGFNTVEVAVEGKQQLSVKLVQSTKRMDEVVVVGYGTQRKIDVTGSVSQIKGDEIQKQPVINPISGLQGKVAGVQITNSGAPGSSPQIRIRGVGTVYGNANPLYIVDGIWYDDISFLNPNDIENISILKDASSEAIYGIRAANGVVIITTRKGKMNSKAVVNYNSYVGNQVVTNQVKMASGPQYAQMVNELDAIGGIAGRYTKPDSYGTTDWYHQILRSALTTNHQVSVAGGSEKTSYNFSLGYLLQDGIVEKNRFERYTAKLQNDFQVFSPLKVGYVVTGSMNKSTDIPGSIFHQLYAAVPIVPVYYKDGTYGDPNDFSVTSSANFNPQVTLDFFNQKSKNYRITGTLYADLKFARHFTFHTNVGGDFGQNEARNYSPVYIATLIQRNAISKLSLTDAKTRNWIIENTLTYDNRFGDHNLKVLAGQGAQSYKFSQTIASADNVPDYGEPSYYLSLGNNYNLRDVDRGVYPLHSTVASYFGRVNYSFQNKYLLTATLRADGSSKFSENDRWGYFPSIGVGWVISSEKFMENQKVFDNLKLRGSWGKIGNMSVPANLSVTTVAQTPQFIYVGGNGTTSPGANVNTIVPPAIFWERGVGTDVGLEASLLKNRLFAEITFYDKRTVKAIFGVPILGSIGTTGSTIIANQATFQNRGVEFMVSWKDNAFNKQLSYSLSANLAVNNNKVLDVTTGTNPIYQAVGTTGSNNWNTRTVMGQPIGQFVGLKAIGVFQSAADVQSYVSKNGVVLMPNARAGDLKMADVNEDGVIDDKDRVVLGNPNPKYTFGFNTSFTYKQFDLSLDFQGIAGVDIYNANLALRYGTENFTEDVYQNRWHGSGTSNVYPSVYFAGGQNPRSNSFYVEDGSYLRIRNAQLGYTLNSSVTNKWKISKLRLYANAQNPLNLFKYRGFSPEVGGSPTRAGVDVDVYPLYATFNFGVNLTF